MEKKQFMLKIKSNSYAIYNVDPLIKNNSLDINVIACAEQLFDQLQKLGLNAEISLFKTSIDKELIKKSDCLSILDLLTEDYSKSELLDYIDQYIV